MLGDTEMVKVLLSHNADPSIKDYSGNNCFHTAAKKGNYKVTDLLCRWLKSSSHGSSAVNDFNYEGVLLSN